MMSHAVPKRSRDYRMRAQKFAAHFKKSYVKPVHAQVNSEESSLRLKWRNCERYVYWKNTYTIKD